MDEKNQQAQDRATGHVGAQNLSGDHIKLQISTSYCKMNISIAFRGVQMRNFQIYRPNLISIQIFEIGKIGNQKGNRVFNFENCEINSNSRFEFFK